VAAGLSASNWLLCSDICSSDGHPDADIERRPHRSRCRLRHLPHAGDDSRTTAISALDAGYRLLDTALRYENEQGVGRAVGEHGLPREEIIVCTKLAGRDYGHDQAIKGFHESLTNLGLDYVDIYLIHWPLR
jgi:aryl-alcohol dehydrogenase-like predicted oxidoreductase